MIKFRDRLAYPFVYIKKGQASLTLTTKIKNSTFKSEVSFLERITRLARLALICNVVENVHSFRFLTKGGCMQIPPLSEKRKICALSATKKHSPILVSVFVWSGLRDSNSLPSPWQGDALPDELNPQLQDLL